MATCEVKHPLVQHKLAQLRRDDLCSADFRRTSNEIASILMVYACEQLTLQTTQVMGWQKTPVNVDTLPLPAPTLVPILRAGLGMLEGCLNVLPDAATSVVGLYRNEETLEPVAYFDKLVADIEQRSAIIIDPMLAAAGTTLATIELLKSRGCRDIKGLFLVAAPEGIDHRLNEQGYILPGLGDAGDRLFGTK